MHERIVHFIEDATTRLGGQHGEEGQIEDEVSGEEVGEEDQAQERAQEEVTLRRLETTFGFEECRRLRHTSRRGA